jgi:hypothetical protein
MISLYIFKIPLVAEDAPAFQICSTKSIMSNPLKNAFQPRMMPMFTSPSCVNFVKDIMQQSNFDAKSFWRQTLAQMSGHCEIANSNALHRVLVRYARIVDGANSSSLTLPITGVFQEGVG